jgi:hypothetical protein
MKHDIIKTDNYLLVVDESEIKVGDWYYVPRTNKAYKCEYDPTELEMEKRFGVREVIAHLPLNGSPILKGVDLLPPLGDNVQNLVREHFELDKELNNPSSFKSGYNKAKEKYKYTEEDLRKAMFLYSAWITGGTPSLRIAETAEERQEQIIQSLSQPKMPIGFECVTQKLFKHNEFMEREFYDSILTTITPEGHTQWVGTYIYE